MTYKQIMVAIDESETSSLALKEAIRLAKDQKAELRVVHIIDESIINPAESHVDYATLWQTYRDEGQRFIDRISAELRQSKVKFNCYLIELKPFTGRLAEKIIEEAESWPADMLVLGTHGRRGFHHLFLGSIAESVMRIATMPVLLIREQKFQNKLTPS